MSTYSIILIVHVISGFTALFVGLVPLLAKKGSKLHNNSGWIYFWGMFGVFVTATIMFFFKPQKLLFLLLIGIFSFYQTFSGVRAVQYKKKQKPVAGIDWVAAVLVSITALAMLGLGGYQVLEASVNLGVLYLVFGGVCLGTSGADLRHFWLRSQQTAPLKRFWLHHHATRMGGSYIATLTAFCVTNISFLPPLVVWLSPGVIGGIILSRVMRKLRRDRAAQHQRKA